MARIINELTGRVRGKVGNLVYRITNGNTQLCALPTSRKVDLSAPAVLRKYRFKLTIKLAKVVNKILPLKFFWKSFVDESADIKKSAFVKIIKKNYGYTNEDGISDNAYIVPTFGFDAETSSVTVTDESVTAVVEPLGTGTHIDTNVEKFIQLVGFFFLKTPTDPNLKIYDFLTLESAKLSLNLTSELSFVVTIGDAEAKLINSYSDKKAFFALVTFDILGNPVRYSNTFIYV